MSKPAVFLSRQLPSKAMERLQAETRLHVNPDDRVLSPKELSRGLGDKPGLLCLLTDTIDRSFLEQHPQLRVVSNYAVGYNNIDLGAATALGIPVTNTPGMLTETSADTAFALLMAVSRRVVEADRFVRSGQWQGWGPLQFLGTDVNGATLGILGLGRIGRAMISRARGFGMRVLYWNRTRLDPEEETRLQVHYREKDELLRQADFVSVHVALTRDTHHLIDAQAFERMKPSAYLINTARGPVVDETALIHALQENQIADAGLDVYEWEPAVSPALYELSQVVLLPHLGSATLATRTRMGLAAVDNLLKVLNDQRPDQLVNPEVWERRRKPS